MVKKFVTLRDDVNEALSEKKTKIIINVITKDVRRNHIFNRTENGHLYFPVFLHGNICTRRVKYIY